jgi:hypothetical protein
MNGNYLETFVAAKIKAARGSRRAASSLAVEETKSGSAVVL